MSDVVGWVAGPTERGTLQLIWSCLLTIFACTWTVLHLNVPAYDDTPTTILLRKLKWMAITILFPEFILSKAICDLRLALHQLLDFEAYLRECNKEITWTTHEVRQYEIHEFRWSWKIETPGGWSRFLYHVFRLPQSYSLRQQADEPQPDNISPSGRAFKNTVPLIGLKTNDPAMCTEGEQLPSAKGHPQSERYNQEGGTQMPGLATQNREEAEEEQRSSSAVHESPLENHQLHSLKGDHYDLSAGTQVRDRSGIKESGAERGPTMHDCQAVPTKTQTASSQEESARLPKIHHFPEKTSPILREQKWTITHSYYAQMGGFLYFGRFRKQVMTAYQLTRRFAWSWETKPEDEHPIKNLVLSKDDIEDKSKADWFLKSLAILQVIWIILNTIIRRATKIPITQLEIATVAFAIMAVLTYLANWWKPKDVSQTTLLHFTGHQYHPDRDESPHHLQSFMSRLQNPASAAANADTRETFCTRVENDVVWLEGETPLLFYLIAGSSLIFGGLHCLAWNFEFPTRIELICWRVASVTSAILPVITLAISAFLSYLATSYLGTQFESEWLAELKSRCSDPTHTEWWNIFLEPHVWSPSWDKVALDDPSPRPAEPPNWEKPSLPGDSHPRMAFSPADRAAYRFKQNLVWFMEALSICRAGGASSSIWQWLSHRTDEGAAVEAIQLLLDHPQLLEFWLGYESFAKSKLRDLKPPNPGGDTGTYLEEIFQVTWKAAAAAEKFERRCRRASKIVSDMSLTLYVVSRLFILVIVFASLRAVPGAVYQNTTWTRFLPSFS